VHAKEVDRAGVTLNAAVVGVDALPQIDWAGNKSIQPANLWGAGDGGNIAPFLPYLLAIRLP
jgi:hypothetical protein